MPRPDTPPVGPTFKGYDADEGGEVRVEYVLFPNGGVGTRTTAFIFKNPGSKKYFDFLSLNGCTDMTPKDKWPMAVNPIAEREYHDIGPYVLISGGGTQVLQVNKGTGTPARDPFFRDHPAGQWYFDPLTSADMDGPTFLNEKRKLDITLPGSATFPGQIFDDAVYMPASFQLMTPGHLGPLMFPANTAQTFTWTTPADTPPGAICTTTGERCTQDSDCPGSGTCGVRILSLVAFTGANGPAVVCVEPNDGSITVPANLMDVARTAYPTGGSVARQTLTHVVRELVDANGPTGRRVDLLGVWCFAGTSYVAN